MGQFKSVTRDEFDAFLAEYPNSLVRNVTTVCEPPNVNYNDFERAPYWPDSVVASHDLFTSYEDMTPANYRVITDIDLPVDDDGTRDTDEPLLDLNGREVKEGDRVRAQWGFDTNGTIFTDEHTVLIRDKGTKYERWSFDDCSNRLRGFEFEIL